MIGAWIGASIGHPGFVANDTATFTLTAQATTNFIAAPYSPATFTLSGQATSGFIAAPYSPVTFTLSGQATASFGSAFSVNRATDAVPTFSAGRATSTIGL